MRAKNKQFTSLSYRIPGEKNRDIPPFSWFGQVWTGPGADTCLWPHLHPGRGRLKPRL